MRRKEFFRVDASLMQQLGANLISDDLQCLVELIKNSYDADAQSVKIIIDAPNTIVIEDDGIGMDEDTIKRGWLTISNSMKLDLKRRGVLSAQHRRTPLGDKGLGRLSTQRLGKHLRIESVAKGSSSCIVVAIDWSAFVAGSDLSEVPVSFAEEPIGHRSQGTRIEISDLLDSQEWVSMDTEKLRLSLATLVSPYEEVASFRLQAFINGVEVSPSLLAKNVRLAAMQRYSFTFDGHKLGLVGHVRGGTFKGNTKKAKEDFTNYFEADGGSSFLEFLLSNDKSKGHGIEKSAAQGMFVSFARTRLYEDIIQHGSFASPGAFYGEIDSFSLDTQSVDIIEETPALSSTAAAKKLVKDMSGIRVYRDGFVIKTAHDWLKLGEGQTSGGSFYGLRPFNTMGYIALSTTHNSVLRETTDREGFIEDNHYRAFSVLLQSFIKSVNDALEYLRRAWTQYVKEREALAHDLPTRDHKVIEARLGETFGQVSEARLGILEAAAHVASVAERQDDSLFFSDPKLLNQLRDAQDLLAKATVVLDEALKRGGLAGILVAELDSLNARLGEVYELVSLGITVEALSHDMWLILERISAETNSIQKHAKVEKLKDLKILRFFEVVRATMMALEKQLDHLDPALRYSREKRDSFRVGEWILETSAYHVERLNKKAIRFGVKVERDFVVTMNKGKLIQILDNLILNSEYWVCASRENQSAAGEIQMTVERPNIVIQDSGRGVEPGFEQTVFDPFVTSKPKGEGRGLGLFIATQLLELDGCTIRLLPSINNIGRRYQFAIGLEGVTEN